MRINNNIPALKTFRKLESTNKALNKSIRALSTGLRINSAADDAAGFAISEKMRSQISGLDMALKNSQDGISFLQTAEGALGDVNSILQRMRELSVQASNDSLTSNDRQYIQLEIDELKSQINQIAGTTQFNRKRLLDGSSGALWSSSDLNVKARINGGLTYRDQFGQKATSEGNYRIEVSTEPGQAQVQKSNIMLIKHKNVIMDVNINNESSINAVSIDNVPAGNYELSCEITTEAKAVATGVYGLELEELNDSIHASVSQSNLLNNASILFEVTEANSDTKYINLKATANILKTDGTTDSVILDNIILRENEFVDLSSLLKLGNDGADSDSPDGAFELSLKNNKAQNFSVGDKFVYNLNVADGVEGADRSVKIVNEQNTSWPEYWKETAEIQTSNSFSRTDKKSASAKVLFLLDDSGSMNTPKATLTSNMESFLSKIVDSSITDLKIGVGRYESYLKQNSEFSTIPDSDLWFDIVTDSAGNVDTSSAGYQNILEALREPVMYSAVVDPYKAIIDGIDRYGDMSDADAAYIVLITDTGDEVGSTNSTAVLNKISSTNPNIVISAICNVNDTWRNPDIEAVLTKDSSGAARAEIDLFSPTWGSDLSDVLGQQIKDDALMQLLYEDTPLYEFTEFSSIFPSSSAAPETLIIKQGSTETAITIEPTDSLKTIAAKLDAVTGGESSGLLIDTDSGQKAISLATSMSAGQRVTYKGNPELIAKLGMRSSLDQQYSLDSSAVKNKDIHFKNFYLNHDNGKVYQGDIVLTTDSDKEMPEYANLTNFEAAYIGQVPKNDVKLKDLNQFWDSQGVFMCEQPQTITINQGDGKNANITLYETDTIDDIRGKINNAIAYDLGQAKYTDNANNFASFVREDEQISGTSESVAGTMLIRSAIPGKMGELTFSGDENLLNALGLNTIQSSSESTYTASVYNAHTGQPVAVNVKSSEPEFPSLIPPEIDIRVDLIVGLKSTWNESTKAFMHVKDDNYSAFIHLSDNTTIFQTGANEGEDFIIQLGDTSTFALGIDNINLLTRENASRSIGILDRAINRVSAQRAKIGAFNNALEHVINNLTTTSANLSDSESRIRDADFSQEYMNFIKLQILNQSGTSMLAQANQTPQSVLSLLE